MAELKAVFLNCTLKMSPAVSNTEALAPNPIPAEGNTFDPETEHPLHAG